MLLFNWRSPMTARMLVVYDDKFGGVRLVAEDPEGHAIVQKIRDDANRPGYASEEGVIAIRKFATGIGIPLGTTIELIPVLS